MNVEIGAEAAQFPEKEYISGIAVALFISAYNQRLKNFFKSPHGFVFWIKHRSCEGRGARSVPVLRANNSKKAGARSARAGPKTVGVKHLTNFCQTFGDFPIQVQQFFP
jgi:hypothetical protein